MFTDAQWKRIAPLLPSNAGRRGHPFGDDRRVVEGIAYRFLTGRDEIVAFLTRKWERELEYRLIKEVWAYEGNRIAVRFAYEFHDAKGKWYRAYGNENWEFDEHGLMRCRLASINDQPTSEDQRLFHWPLGTRPQNHPGLSDLGL